MPRPFLLQTSPLNVGSVGLLVIRGNRPPTSTTRSCSRAVKRSQNVAIPLQSIRRADVLDHFGSLSPRTRQSPGFMTRFDPALDFRVSGGDFIGGLSLSGATSSGTRTTATTAPVSLQSSRAVSAYVSASTHAPGYTTRPPHYPPRTRTTHPRPQTKRTPSVRRPPAHAPRPSTIQPRRRQPERRTRRPRQDLQNRLHERHSAPSAANRSRMESIMEIVISS